MTTRRRRRPTAKYACQACGARQLGDAGMVTCPDCGGHLVQLYGPRVSPTVASDDVDRDRLLRGMFGDRER